MKAAIYTCPLLALLCLLILATVASADCAWVLWEQETWTTCKEGATCRSWEKGVRIAEFLDRDSAFETKAECVAEMRSRRAATGNGKPLMVKRNLNGVYQDVMVINRPSCWPAVVDIRDTVDPRGPK